MEAYVDEVRKLEDRFDGIQAEHVPRAENDIADYLSKRAAFKLPVEPGTFVLRLTQPSVEPSTGQNPQEVPLSGGNGRYVVPMPEPGARRQGPKAFLPPWERLSLRPGLDALPE